jgi:hypothetical protein
MSDLPSLLSSFRQRAFRLETRDHYDVPQEADWFQAFLRGEGIPELSPENDSWLKLVSGHCRTGKRMQRVHIVSQPLTDYCRFELAMCVSSVGAGEEIRIIERDQMPELRRMQEDFWLFDDAVVIVLDYDDNGRFLGTRVAEDLTYYREVANLTLTHSIHLDEYLARTT